jgi:hypothetical protein
VKVLKLSIVLDQLNKSGQLIAKFLIGNFNWVEVKLFFFVEAKLVEAKVNLGLDIY